MLVRGAAVIGLDLSRYFRDLYHRADFPGLVCDLTDAQAPQQPLESGLRRVGGLEVLVLNAGMFPGRGRARPPRFAAPVRKDYRWPGPGGRQ